jgi:hypothetical protein
VDVAVKKSLIVELIALIDVVKLCGYFATNVVVGRI